MSIFNATLQYTENVLYVGLILLFTLSDYTINFPFDNDEFDINGNIEEFYNHMLPY